MPTPNAVPNPDKPDPPDHSCTLRHFTHTNSHTVSPIRCSNTIKTNTDHHHHHHHSSTSIDPNPHCIQKSHQLSIEIRPPPPDEPERGDYSSSSPPDSDPTGDGPAGLGVPIIAIDIHPPTPERKSPERPRDLIIPQLVIQHPSPTKERTAVVVIPGSPPPQRANHTLDATILAGGGTSRQQHQKR